ADHLGCYGYARPTSPALDAFARDALLFENAYAPMPTTLPSHVSLLTSSLPARHGVLSNFRYLHIPFVPGEPGGLRSVAQTLSDAGYATAAFTSASPLSRGTGVDAGFAAFDAPPPFDENDESVRRTAGETVDRALAWLAARGDGAPPFFLWVHVFDPHLPYEPPAPWDRAFTTDAALLETLAARGIPDVLHRHVAGLANAYDGEISYADEQVGRLLDALRERGLYDDAVVAIAGDHGEGLMAHGEPGHELVWRGTVRVPLVLRWPGGPRGARAPQVASLVDVLPTLRAHTALPLAGAAFDGGDLLADAEREALSQEPVRDGAPRQRTFALSAGRWRYWYLSDGPARLYDVEADAAELRDVIGEHPDVAERMRARVEALLEDARARPGATVTNEIDADLRKRLEQLGYVE
ncbi:MAG: sulfatase, partial [Myxococcales bacterium]|nr:sulfatase [Myxococcales bacterium]